MTSEEPQRSGFGGRFAAPVLIGPALNPINTTMISVALVPISQATGAPASVVIWLVAGLYLVSAIFQPTMGKLADLFGPRKVYITGLAIAGLGGLIPLISPTFTGALVSRLAIGIGTSSAYPSAMTLIKDQSLRLGVETPQILLSGLSISSLVTAAIGPVLGGVLIEHFGWQSIFLVNVPFALVAIVLVCLWLPADSTRVAGSSPRPAGIRALDLPGIACFAIAVTSALFFLLDPGGRLYWLVPIAIAAAVILVLWELRQPAPFLDVRMLAHNAALTRTYLRLFLVYMCIYLVVYAFTQWVQAVAGLSSEAAGLMQLPAAICAAVATVLVSRSSRVRWPLVIAAGTPILGGMLLATVHADSPLWLLLVVVALFGIPQGLASVSNQAALYRQAPGAQMGSAAGLSRTSVQIGAIVASSLIGRIFGPSASDPGLHVIAWIIVIIAVAALILTLADRALRDGDRAPATTQGR
ncbi:MFS transporter [Brooklawnia cerclae]|uniref:MFS family permease n=1 Tax=Brooklawnia cerclae TaxID=349934 RepID=A0ABX0SMI1_9ACTN|nr:MFS transporter [Brooklawnia cerclae]NIH57971.1 MFS family permease [Brooklawnia cerclae]